MGDQLDILDENDDWQSGTVVEVTSTEVVVRFDHKESKHDEILPQSSPRIAPFQWPAAFGDHSAISAPFF